MTDAWQHEIEFRLETDCQAFVSSFWASLHFDGSERNRFSDEVELSDPSDWTWIAHYTSDHPLSQAERDETVHPGAIRAVFDEFIGGEGTDEDYARRTVVDLRK